MHRACELDRDKNENDPAEGPDGMLDIRRNMNPRGYAS